MKVVPPRLTPGAHLRRALEAWMAAQQEAAQLVQRFLSHRHGHGPAQTDLACLIRRA